MSGPHSEEQPMLEDEVARLDQAFAVFIRKLSNLREVAGLTNTQAFLLRVLKVHGPSRMSDLADYLGISLGATTNVTDPLVEAGLLRRSRSETDRRVVMVDITETGEAKFAETQALEANKLRGLLHELGEPDADEFVRLLERAVEIISKRPL